MKKFQLLFIWLICSTVLTGIGRFIQMNRPMAKSPATVNFSGTESESTARQITDPEVVTAQYLAIEATATIKGETFQLEVARTPKQQATGLMYRKQLEDDRGMLFPVDPPEAVELWMKQTRVPLDMIFLKDGKVVGLRENITPCQINPCETYGSGDVVDSVLELRGGTIARLGLKVRDRVSIVEAKNS
jgi:uncharacterized protein